MRNAVMTGRFWPQPWFVLLAAALVVAGCSNSGRFAGPSWNLTGGKDAVLLPPKQGLPPQPTSAAPDQPPPPVVYRGGRDPITGRAPQWGGPQPGIERTQLAPLPEPAQPAASPNLQPIQTRPPQAPHSLPQQTPAARPKAAEVTPRGGTVEVRPGQSLASIAGEHRVSIASLMSTNSLRDPYVIPGQILKLPAR
jgi:LysM domain